MTLLCIHQEEGWTNCCLFTQWDMTHQEKGVTASRNNCIDFKNSVVFLFFSETSFWGFLFFWNPHSLNIYVPVIDSSNYVTIWVFCSNHQMYLNFRDIKIWQRCILELMKYVCVKWLYDDGESCRRKRGRLLTRGMCGWAGRWCVWRRLKKMSVSKGKSTVLKAQSPNTILKEKDRV